MSQSNSLYNLIKSLNKTEKAYFKKFASRHVLGKKNKYVSLFEAIAAGKNGYDERVIKRKFHNERFIKNFSVMKKYLYKMILKSLSSYYSDSSPNNEVRNELRYIEILYKKGLFENCSRILNRALKQTYRTDSFLTILQLLRWKKNLIYEGVYEGNELVNFETAYNEELDIIGKIKNLNDYRLLSYRARSLIKGNNPFSKKDSFIKGLQNLLKDPLMQSEKQALSYPAIVTFYHILATVNESLNKNLVSLDYRKKLIGIMENHPEKLKGNITNYIVSIYNILGACFSLKKYSELEYYIKKLRLLEKTYSNKISKNDRMQIIMGSAFFELRMHIDRGEFSESSQNLLVIEKGLEEFHNLIVNSEELYFFYLLGYGYFGAGKITGALKWINKLLNEKDARQENILFAKSKLINLIIHYDLGNFELLDYLIKSAYRFFRKNGFKGANEKIVIEFLKQLPKISSQAQLLKLFTESLNLLNSAESNTNDRLEIRNNFTNSAEFDITSWLESKISGKSFEEIVRAKYLKGNN